MPRPDEYAEIVVNGQRYRDWKTVSVTRSGVETVSRFAFTAASPIESAPNWSGQKLRIGDACQVYLAGKVVIDGFILGRQPAYNANQHALQVVGSSKTSVVTRATVDRSKSEFKGYGLSQIANSLLQPYDIKFVLKGETSGADKPFEKVNLQTGETVFDAINRLAIMRNIYLTEDVPGHLVGFRTGKTAGAFAELKEGRNIKEASAIFNYEGKFSEIEAVGQRPGSDNHYGEDASDVSAKINNKGLPFKIPFTLMAEMPGDAQDMKMRAQRENGENLSTVVEANIVVQGWQHSDGALWIEKIGETVSIFSPMLFTDDWMSLVIQDVTHSQNEAGTLTTLGLVLPERFNGGGQIEGGLDLTNPR